MPMPIEMDRLTYNKIGTSKIAQEPQKVVEETKTTPPFEYELSYDAEFTKRKQAHEGCRCWLKNANHSVGQ